MKNRFIMATFFSTFLLFLPSVQATNFTEYQTVDSNKTWTIKFTQKISLDDLTKQGIVVTYNDGNSNVGKNEKVISDLKDIFGEQFAGYK